MSINACSINEHTINTLCGSRRQAIINSLLPPIVVAGGGQQQHVHPDTQVPLNIFRREVPREDTVIDFNTLELPYIQVTVELAGETFMQTLDRDDTMPMINVYGLILSDPAVSGTRVNISDITLRIIE